MARFFGALLNGSEWQLREKERKVQRIFELEKDFSKLSDDELREKTKEFKNRLKNGETLDELLEEAFAVVREASSRILGMKHFPVQLIGGIILHEGNIAEMKTGEGKTLVSTLPAYLNALTGDGVFVITVNEYLAARDREEMGQVHEFLGLSVGLIQSQMSTEEKKAAYACDITYGTNSEFGFDYLRDNMVVVKENRVQRKLNYAILDEVDLILIDEARTPLIITGQGSRPSQYYAAVNRFVKSLVRDRDFEYVEDEKLVLLTDAGMDNAEKVFGLENIADESNTELLHHIRQSLHANHVMKKDQEYVVKDGEIQIIDKFTGRLLPGRRFSNGLHQALETKENLDIQKESSTMATITYQNFFRMFHKLSGMTGTAYTERLEIKSIYGMEVVKIPTNKPMIRKDYEDFVFRTEEGKLKAVVDEVEKRYQKGQPVLIGTIYIDKSVQLSELLKERDIPHKLLNAMQNKDEAEIIAMAGQKGAVTIATNMAGRGTDIKLGEGVAELGGLLVIGTERHEARRIDNQLRGRSGRQGDPGESQFFVSLEDSLFERFGKEKVESMQKMIEKIGTADDEPLREKILTKAIKSIQKNIEGLNYRIRKSTLAFDEILNKQREIIYSERNKILNGEDMSDFIKFIIIEGIKKLVHNRAPEDPYIGEWDFISLQSELNRRFSFHDKVNFNEYSEEELNSLTEEGLIEIITEEAMKIYKEREEEIQAKQLRFTERLILMKNMDAKWIEHLDVMEQIKQGIGIQSAGRQDPVHEFNKEASSLFEIMLDEIKEETIKIIFALRRKMEKEGQDIDVARTEAERKERVEMLEEKYKINRKHLLKIPANLPKLGFNMDINAVEEVEVELGLYYFEKGVEERLKGFDRKITVTGIFPVAFEKLKDKDWNMGWHAIKAFVAGQEAAVINFLITEPINLKDLERKRHEARSIGSNIKFFSNRNPLITFNLGLKDSGKDKIKVAVVMNGSKESLKTFEIPVNNEQASIILNRPEEGWKNGFYELLLLENSKKLSIPFMIVDEFERQADKLDIPITIQVREQLEAELVAELVYLETKQQVINQPMKINRTGVFNFGLKRQEEDWKIGRYEFRLLDCERIVLTRHFLVS